MSAITGAVVVADQRNMLVTDMYREINASVAFGNGTLTYPSGGIPLTAAQFGFRNFISSLFFIDAGNANGYVYKYNKATMSIRIYQGAYLTDAAADNQLIELVAGTAAPAAVTLQVMAKGR